MAKLQQSTAIVKVKAPDTASMVAQGKRIVPKLSLLITNQDTLNDATMWAKAAEQWIVNVEATVDPVVDATNKAHKAAVKMRSELLAPVAGPLKLLKLAIFTFIETKRREDRERQLKLEAEQDRKNKEDADRIAAAAKKTGADRATVAAVKEEVLSRPAPIVQPKVTAPETVTTRTTWDVNREKYDLYALCVAIAQLPKEGNHLLELVEPNFVNLRRRAVSGHETAIIPGFTVKKTVGGSL
jgi:hypothetical protein